MLSRPQLEGSAVDVHSNIEVPCHRLGQDHRAGVNLPSGSAAGTIYFGGTANGQHPGAIHCYIRVVGAALIQCPVKIKIARASHGDPVRIHGEVGVDRLRDVGGAVEDEPGEGSTQVDAANRVGRGIGIERDGAQTGESNIIGQRRGPGGGAKDQ